MIHVWYFVFFVFFLLLNVKIDCFVLRPDLIYLSYFSIGLLIVVLVAHLNASSNERLFKFTDELVYYVKMSAFIYLSILDNISANYYNLSKAVLVYKYIFNLIGNKFFNLFKDINQYKIKQKYCYLYNYMEKSLMFEFLVKKFIYKLFISNVVKLTKIALFSRNLNVKKRGLPS
jgi:hypothetical protein